MYVTPHHTHTLHLESAPAYVAVPSSFPTIQYTLNYKKQSKILSVHLQQIHNLSARHNNKSIDSFVSLYLLPHKEVEFESKLVLNSLNPIFEQEFVFTGQPVLELVKEQILIFRIFEHIRWVYSKWV